MFLVFLLHSGLLLGLPELMPADLVHSSCLESLALPWPICTVRPRGCILGHLCCQVMIILLLLHSANVLPSLLVQVVVANGTDQVVVLQLERLLDKRTVTDWRLALSVSLLHLCQWILTDVLVLERLLKMVYTGVQIFRLLKLLCR